MSDYNYPYTDFHRLNLDWLIEYVQNLTAGTITQDDILQALGDAPDKLISQKATTDILNARSAEVKQLLAEKSTKRISCRLSVRRKLRSCRKKQSETLSLAS